MDLSEIMGKMIGDETLFKNKIDSERRASTVEYVRRRSSAR